MKSYIKEAEQNVLNNCKELSEIMEMLDGLSALGNRYLDIEEHKTEFFEGLTKMRNAISKKHSRSISMLMNMVGVGGEKAIEYCKERAKEIFNGKYVIMNYLDKYCKLPGSWSGIDEENLKKEAQEKLKEGD